MLDDYELAVTQSALAVSTLKALDAGNTNKAYRATLLHLKDSMLRTQRYVNRGAVPPDERDMLRAVSQVVLHYVEQQRDRLGGDAPSDHCALEVTEALADTLTNPEDLKRVQVLHGYFSSRFVKEREFYN
jgi:hypothetical protein